MSVLDPHYILIHGKPKQEPDLVKWANWFETRDRLVDLTNVGALSVSTVFLGSDHNFSRLGQPILWETMVFPYADDENQEHFRRYTSLADAKKGHWEIVDELRSNLAEAKA